MKLICGQNVRLVVSWCRSVVLFALVNVLSFYQGLFVYFFYYYFGSRVLITILKWAQKEKGGSIGSIGLRKQNG